jgi:hypothetical protein
MQAHPRPEPYTVLEYQSKEARVFGVEVRPAGASGPETVLEGLRWVGKSKAFSKELTFLVMALPARIETQDVRKIAECAAAEGLAEKLCLVASGNAQRLSTTIEDLKRSGLRALLGGVGAGSRFSDMTDHPIDGIVIEQRLVSTASGDPCAASILDAILGLSKNLGLRSFANECATQIEFDFATSAGIDYLTYGRPCLERGGDVASAVRRSKPRRQLVANR